MSVLNFSALLWLVCTSPVSDGDLVSGIVGVRPADESSLSTAGGATSDPSEKLSNEGNTEDAEDLSETETASDPEADAESDANGDTDADSIVEILAGNALLDDATAGSALDDSHRILLELPRGFLQTPTVQSLLSHAADDTFFTRNETIPAVRARQAFLAIAKGLELHQGRVAAQRLPFDIPLADHPLVDIYIDYFTGRGRWFFERWLARADRYVPMMQAMLQSKGLPRDLVYVAMIESGFSSRAVSTARACGFWQFIGSTARLYKLKIDPWIDERRDFVRSTEAAAAYLSFLHHEFGDWHLAWAGYNGGEGRIRRALAKHEATSFWELAELPNALPKETMHYVPKVIAAAIIAKDRHKYGFDKVKPLPPLTWDEVETAEQADLSALSRKFGFDLETLKDLNPSLTHGLTPPGRRFVVRVPPGSRDAVALWLATAPLNERAPVRQHIVAYGENLPQIARRYATTVEAIRSTNRLSKRARIRTGQVLIMPSSATTLMAAELQAESESGRRASVDKDTSPKRSRSSSSKRMATATSSKASGAKTTAGAKLQVAKNAVRNQPTARHVVAAGETLWSISQRYGVSVQRIKKWNDLRDNRIAVGQSLRILAPQA